MKRNKMSVVRQKRLDPLVRMAVIVSLTTWLLSGCTFRGESDNAYVEIETTPSSLVPDFPPGNYLEGAWLEDGLLAFLYLPQSLAGSPDPWNYQILIYEIALDRSRALQSPTSDECFTAWATSLSHLPNGGLGFLYHCNIKYEHTYGDRFRLYMWDPQSETLQVLRDYPDQFFATTYTFGPEMTTLVQEQSAGEGLANELYQVHQDGSMEELFPEWQRLKSPAWSRDGRLLAFMGTETYPGKTGDPMTFEQIELLYNHPWDLYLLDTAENMPAMVFSGIQFPSQVKWALQDRLISFTGTYGDQEGIWILNVKTLALMRMWPRSVRYDWSPSGQQMVILDDGEGATTSHPVIVDVPAEVFQSQTQ